MDEAMDWHWFELDSTLGHGAVSRFGLTRLTSRCQEARQRSRRFLGPHRALLASLAHAGRAAVSRWQGKGAASSVVCEWLLANPHAPTVH